MDVVDSAAKRRRARRLRAMLRHERLTTAMVLPGVLFFRSWGQLAAKAREKGDVEQNEEQDEVSDKSGIVGKSGPVNE